MATIHHYFDKDTFIPEKNYFSTKRVKCSREEDEIEMQLEAESYKWANIGFYGIGIGWLGGIILMVIFGALGYIINPWYDIGTAFGVVFAVGSIIFANVVCWPKEDEYNETLRKYRIEHEDELWTEATKDLRAYNEEQIKVAETWRAMHPLEEKIRACLLDPKSSVDVANLARYYAEEYLKENGNEDLG